MQGVSGVRTWVMGWLIAALTVILVTLFAVTRVHAQEIAQTATGSATPSAQVAAPQLLQGSALTLVNDSESSVFALGSSLRQSAKVQGDVAVMASSVIIDGEVAQDVYAMAGSVVIGGHVRGNVVVMAGEVQIEPSARIDGTLIVLTETLRLDGTVHGSLQAHAKNVYWSGTVLGDANVETSTFTLSDTAATATVSGSTTVLEKSESATVSGEFAVEVSPRQEQNRGTAWTRRVVRSAIIGAFLLSAVWFVVRNRWLQWYPAITASWRNVLLTGGAVSLLWPLVACVLVLTFVGIPLAIAGTLLWFVLLWFGWVFSALMLVMPLTRRQTLLPTWVIVVLIGAVVGGAQSLPLIGWILRLVLGITGLGIFSWGSYQAFRLPSRR